MNNAATSVKPVRPTWRQALVMLGGGALLASSACYGYVRNERNAPDAIVAAFFVAFAMGMMLVLVAVVRVVVRTARQPAMSEAGAPARALRPTLKQTLIMLGSGVVLGASSCFGFLAVTDWKSGTYGPFATGFYIGCLVTLGGLIMLLIRGARSVMKRRT